VKPLFREFHIEDWITALVELSSVFGKVGKPDEIRVVMILGLSLSFLPLFSLMAKALFPWASSDAEQVEEKKNFFIPE
jgi:hypothetical protein